MSRPSKAIWKAFSGAFQIVEVAAAAVRPLEPPAAYTAVPRLLLGVDGGIRPWEPPGSDAP